MKQLSLLLFAYLLSFTAFGQSSQGQWYRGYVELRSGEQHEGGISYYTDSRVALLQIYKEEQVLTFDASQIALFSFYDEEMEINRTFYSLPFRPEGVEHEVTLFFESLVEGKYLLVLNRIEYRNETRKVEDTDLYNQIKLGRQRGSGQSTSGVEAPLAGATSHDDFTNVLRRDGKKGRQITVVVPYETLYLMVPNTSMQTFNLEPTSLATRVVQYRKPNTELLFQLLKSKQHEMESYIAANNLDVRKRSDLLDLIHHYNELKAEDQEIN